MFPDQKKAALLVLAHGQGDEPDDETAPPDEPDDASIAAEDLIAAVQQKDPDAVTTALRAIFDSFQSGDEEEPDDGEEELPAPPFARGGMVKRGGKC